MQILQVHYGDFVPRYQIFMFDDSKIYGSIKQWQEPTTIWDGKPVLGFMAETFLDDLSVGGPYGDGTKGDFKLRNVWCIFDILKFQCGERCSHMVTSQRFCP